MANKRLKKKKQKQTQNALLQSKGYTQKQIKRMDTTTRTKEIKRLEKNQAEKNRILANRQSLLNDDIPLSIITAERLDRKSYKKLTNKQKSSYRLRGKKLDWLREKGYTYKVVKSDLSKSWQYLKFKYDFKLSRERIKCPKTLYVGFSEIIGGFILPDFKTMTDRELFNNIQERINEAIMIPSDSNDFRGAFQVMYGERSQMNAYANAMFKRGYNMNAKHLKLNPKRYNKISLSNEWAEREFLELTYTIICQQSNDDVPETIKLLKRYCNDCNLSYMAYFHLDF